MRHQPQKDIGIDAEIEVTEPVSPHPSTGQLFKVQLKGTDEPDLDRALAVRVGIDHYNYWTSLNLPVLIALYHAPTGILYTRWVHLFYVSPKPGQETVTLRLSPSDAATDVDPALWLQDMIVTVTPQRIEIRPAPWSSEYAVIVRNNSASDVYDVSLAVLLDADSALDLGHLHVEPAFEVDWSFGFSPIGIVLASVGRPLRQYQISRLGPRTDGRLRVIYKPDESEPEGKSRAVEFRITSQDDTPSPTLRVHAPYSSTEPPPDFG